MLNIFIGTDARQPVAYNTLQYSILANTSLPITITPLKIQTLPVKRMGLTEFTYSRYLVPWLCDYQGPALFLDADMVVDFDIEELFRLDNQECGVSVVKKDKKFEWPSLMLFNCELCQRLRPDIVEFGVPQDLASWSDGGIGELPLEWNYCVGYDQQDIVPKLIHFTAGIPIWPETRDSKFADVWHKYWRAANSSVSFAELMGTSVHVEKVQTGAIK